jgi:hypothetical protein
VPHVHEPISAPEVDSPEGGKLGRIVDHKPENINYPARGVLFAEDAPLRTKVWWTVRPAWDQELTSSCVVQTGGRMALTSPWRLQQPRKEIDILMNQHLLRGDLYREMQELDSIPGTNYDGGTFDGIAKALRARGLIDEWRWCFGLQDVLQALSHVGPVALGMWWNRSQDTPGPNGRITYDPSSGRRGGHEIMADRINVKRRTVGGPNSWGSSWGRKGWWEMDWDNLEAALEDDGDAAIFVKVS